MAFNQTLKFSWGHIIAFVAMIFISYVSFMGITYFTDGDFIVAGLGVIMVNLVLVLFFIVPQILKGTDEKFKKKIVFERLLVFTAPFFYVVAMFAFAHFWSVFENRKNVETTFAQAISTTKGMFDSYEAYAINRIQAYNKNFAKSKVSKVGRDNAVEALKLQILDENYVALKESAEKWINNASSATIWNVFMIGNRKEIEKALDGWNASLNRFSKKIMTDEPSGVVSFSSMDPSVIKAKTTLGKVQGLYTSIGKTPTGISVVLAVILYLLLMVPYFIQRRNTKSTVRLIGSESVGTGFKIIGGRTNSGDEGMSFTLDKKSSLNNGDHGSFTL